MTACTPWSKTAAVYFDARAEHLFLLRCEGRTFAQCGDCVGISRQRAEQVIKGYGFRLSKALRCVVWPELGGT